MKKVFSVFCSLFFLTFLSTPANSENISLEPSAWDMLSPWGGNAVIRTVTDGLAINASGIQQGTQALYQKQYDLRNAVIYFKWKVSGPPGNYALWGVGLGWQNFNNQLDTGIYAAVGAGGSIPAHGAGFSTVHSSDESKVISDNVWLYTRIDVSINNNVTAVTATKAFDDQGGTVFYAHSYTLSNKDWQSLSHAYIFLNLLDNESADAGLILAEIRVADKTDSLLLGVKTDSNQVRLDWTPLQNINDYILYYALSDNTGGIDINSIGFVELGNLSTLSATLWNGAQFYTAIQARFKDGSSTFSNIENFMTFSGQVMLPETGTVLMQITDPGGIGNASIEGTNNPEASKLVLHKIIINDGGGERVAEFDVNHRIEKFSYLGNEMLFEHHPDGSLDVQILDNGTEVYNSRSSNRMSDRLDAWLRVAKPDFCLDDRESYVESKTRELYSTVLSFSHLMLVTNSIYLSLPENGYKKKVRFEKILFILELFISDLADKLKEAEDHWSQDYTAQCSDQDVQPVYLTCSDCPAQTYTIADLPEEAMDSWVREGNSIYSSRPGYQFDLGNNQVVGINIYAYYKLENAQKSLVRQKDFYVNSEAEDYEFVMNFDNGGYIYREIRPEGMLYRLRTIVGNHVVHVDVNHDSAVDQNGELAPLNKVIELGRQAIDLICRKCGYQ